MCDGEWPDGLNGATSPRKRRGPRAEDPLDRDDPDDCGTSVVVDLDVVDCVLELDMLKHLWDHMKLVTVIETGWRSTFTFKTVY